METDAKGKPAELSMLTLLRKIWFIGVLGALFNTWNSMETSILTPYLFSRVQCCGIHGQLPQNYDVTAHDEIQAIQAEAKSLGLEGVEVVEGARGDPVIRACSLPHFPPASRLWSRSARCASGSFVADSAQRVIGLNTPLQTLATLAVLPVGGTVADRCGRHPVMLVYASLVTLACVLYVLDTQLFPVWGDAAVLIGGVLMCPCWEPKDTVVWGAISDTLGRGLSLKRALSMQQGFIQGGWIFGFTFAFFTLGLRLVNYLVPWVIFTCVACSLVAFLCVAVPETLPERLRGSVRMDMFNPLTTQWDALLMLCRDRFLVLLMLTGVIVYIHFVGFITLKFTYTMAIGFSMQEAMLPNLTGAVVQCVCAFAVSKFGGTISAMKLYVLGNVMFIPAYAIYGPLLDTFGHAAPYVADGCLGIALGCFFPATATMVSSRVGEAHQAKCQAAVQWINKVGAAIGPIIWSLGIFDATATGTAFRRPALASLLLSMAASAIALYMQDREDSFPPVLKAQKTEPVGESLDLQQIVGGC